MTPKEYLQQYREAVRRADAAIYHRDELRAMAERITPNYDSFGGGSHQSGDRLGETVAKMIDAETRIDAEVSMLIATEREIEATIDRLQNPTYRTLLYERYINGKTWEQIAIKMNYSYMHIVHRMHPCALKAVAGVLAEH